MFGYPPGALTGIAVDVLVPDRLRDAARHAPRRLYRRIPRPRPMGTASELWAERLDRTEFPADISLAPLGAPERAAHPGRGA